ncbi:MAG TPA: hypothetical protein VMU68_08035, partial [Acidimicrobiales bacterium]|nr:hypothetical protein [Acidimicrobiales bacterium]
NSTISVLNSGVNDRRGRFLLGSLVSMLNILPGVIPQIMDVRQSGGSPNVDPKLETVTVVIRVPVSDITARN